MLKQNLSNIEHFKEVMDLIFFVIIYIILYYSIIKDFKLKRQICLLGIFYFSIFNIKYALISIIILFVEQENNNFFEHFKNNDDSPMKVLDNVYADAIKYVGDTVKSTGDAISNYGKEVNNYNSSQEEEIKETFINMDSITGSMKGMAEFVHNNNSLGKIKENLKCGAQKFIKDSFNFKDSKPSGINKKENEQNDNRSNESSNDSSQDSEEEQENFTNMNRSKRNKIKKNNVKQDKIKVDTIKEDTIKVDKVKENNIKQDNIKEDNIKEDNIKEDNIKEDNIKEDQLKKNKEQKPQKLLIEHLNDYIKYDNDFDTFKKRFNNNWNKVNNELLKN